MWVFFVFIGAVILERLWELRLAKRNAKHMLALGGYEVGSRHYPLFIALHSAFFVSLILEGSLRKNGSVPIAGDPIAVIPLALFIAAQLLRFWCIRTLGRFWNVRIYVVAGFHAIRSGPYRLLRHPNYLAVTIEIASLPLIFHAVYTAILFSILNFLLLNHRITVEEHALRDASPYEKDMQTTPRGFFWRIRKSFK